MSDITRKTLDGNAQMNAMMNETLNISGALLVKLGYVTGNQSMGRVVMLSIHLSNTLLLLAALTVTAGLLGTVQIWRELGVGGVAHVILADVAMQPVAEIEVSIVHAEQND